MSPPEEKITRDQIEAKFRGRRRSTIVVVRRI